MDGSIPSVPDLPPMSGDKQKIANAVQDSLYDVVDPELGINVVDLGLVYDIWVDEDGNVVVYMTLTSPACPLTDMLEDQSTDAVVGRGIADNMRIEWVWTPPWGPHMITEEGREQLRALGFAV
ncbi:MAG: metal-sulfur cluster assembly factor [Corynebacterium kroppenstedtii]|nr:metal-sulfur cluster assembly factor [Corynebacterium kroppenstedtii]MDU7287423.1 metal-sulfur cluster assembly factor [Corynebacterium kroppenstedtii]